VLCDVRFMRAAPERAMLAVTARQEGCVANLEEPTRPIMRRPARDVRTLVTFFILAYVVSVKRNGRSPGLATS
jgi:hypothetical protein